MKQSDYDKLGYIQPGRTPEGIEYDDLRDQLTNIWKEPLRKWVRTRTLASQPNVWIKICEAAGLRYRERSVSHSLRVLCNFHDEMTPSLALYPSGNFTCYGCGQRGELADFICYDTDASSQPAQLIRALGRAPVDLEPAIQLAERLGELEGVRDEHQRAYFSYWDYYHPEPPADWNQWRGLNPGDDEFLDDF